MPAVSCYLTPTPELFQAANIHKGQVTCFDTTPVCNVFKQGEIKHMTQECGSDTNMQELYSINAVDQVGVLFFYSTLGDKWMSAIVHRTEPPESSIVGISNGTKMTLSEIIEICSLVNEP